MKTHMPSPKTTYYFKCYLIYIVTGNNFKLLLLNLHQHVTDTYLDRKQILTVITQVTEIQKLSDLTHIPGKGKSKGTGKGEVVPGHNMKAYQGDVVEIHAFLTSALLGVKWSASCTAILALKKEPTAHT
jgi:hypothetical protein